MSKAHEQTARVLFDVARSLDDVANALVGFIEGISPRQTQSEQFLRLDRMTLETGLVRAFAGELLEEITGKNPEFEDKE